MNRSQNPHFAGRQSELARFAQLLQGGEPLTILNVHGPSGIGKSWLLERFRQMCETARVPFAFLNPREVSNDPVSILTGFARRMGLQVEWDESNCGFDQLLPNFIDALRSLDASVIVLMLDNYDQMFDLDPQVRHLVRNLAQQAPLDGYSGDRQVNSVDESTSNNWPRFILVVGSERPLGELWPLSPIYRDLLQAMPLHDFTFQETVDYLTQLGVPSGLHQAFFHLTQGYPLALALAQWLDLPEIGGQEIESLLPTQDREKLVCEILERALRSLESDPLRARVVESLRVSAVVHTFDQPLLSAMLDQGVLSDDLFDRVTALSMVVGYQQPGRPRTFTLHGALRKAILEDAEARGLKDTLDEYRRRALAFYTARRTGVEQTEAMATWGLDVLFLHGNTLIHHLFFDRILAPLSTGLASFNELDKAAEPLMRGCFWYKATHFEGEPLDRLVQQTCDWVVLDHALHRETLRYFEVIRRTDASGLDRLCGFILNVPVTSVTLPLLRQDTLGIVYEQGVGTLNVDERCYFLLRLVGDDLDIQSALIRAMFTKMAHQKFDTLITATPWDQVNSLLSVLGFEVLARGVEHEGYTYTISRLGVKKFGGPLKWLFQLVRQDVELPELADWELFKGMLQESLERLHEPHQLAASPLIDEFALASLDATAWHRAQALTLTLQTVLETMRLPPNLARPDDDFHVLNESFGIVDEAWQRFEYSLPPQAPEIRKCLHCAVPSTYYNYRNRALEAFARAFRRQFGKA